MTDHLADALNTMKTHEIVGQNVCTIKATKLTEEVLKHHKHNKNLKEYKVFDVGWGGYFVVHLEVCKNDCGVIKPRMPVKRHDWAKKEQEFIPGFGVGLLIVSTSQGIMTNVDAEEKHIGGRLVAYVY